MDLWYAVEREEGDRSIDAKMQDLEHGFNFFDGLDAGLLLM